MHKKQQTLPSLFLPLPQQQPQTATNETAPSRSFSPSTTLFVLYDIESTGRHVYKDRICQLGACIWDPRRPSDCTQDDDDDACSFKTFVKPKYPMSLGAFKVHNIAAFRYARAQNFSLVIHQWQAWIAMHAQDRGDITDVVLCAHNGHRFDSKMLVTEMLRHDAFSTTPSFALPMEGAPTVHFGDSLEVAKQLYADHASKALGALHAKLLGKEIENAHDAMADVYAMRSVLQHAHDSCADELCAELYKSARPFERVAHDVDEALASKQIDLEPVVEHATVNPSHDDNLLQKAVGYAFWDVATNSRYKIVDASAGYRKRWVKGAVSEVG